MTELKPCPLCGGAGKYHGSYFEDDVCEYVSCTRCNASTPLMYKKGESIEWWNRRANPWHTGTPTENGEYLVCRVPEAGHLFRFNQLCIFGDLMGSLDHKIFYVGEPGKDSFENITASVIAWQRIESFKEDET